MKLQGDQAETEQKMQGPQGASLCYGTMAFLAAYTNTNDIHLSRSVFWFRLSTMSQLLMKPGELGPHPTLWGFRGRLGNIFIPM